MSASGSSQKTRAAIVAGRGLALARTPLLSARVQPLLGLTVDLRGATVDSLLAVFEFVRKRVAQVARRLSD